MNKSIKNNDNLLLGCNGSKKLEYERYLKDIILDNINKDSIFIEPFCGSAIISYKLYHTNNIKCHINDLETFRIQFYLDAKNIDFLNKVNDNILNVKNIDDVNKLYLKKDIFTNYESYYYSKLISTYKNGIYNSDRKIKPINMKWNDFLNNSIITNEDYTTIMELYKDDEDAFIYLDPPYLDSFNKGYISHQSNDMDHTKIYIDILNYLKICKCKILMSINSNSITKYLYKDYIKNDYEYKYNTSNKNKDGIYYKKSDNILIISNF